MLKGKSKVSIIVPCFNSGATLGNTIESIKAQTWKNIEIIVVDDGSNDPITISTLKKMKGVRLIKQKNKGLPCARNIGIKVATGEFILPLDSDDRLEPKAIELMLDFLCKNSNVAYVFSYINLEGESFGVLDKNYNFFEQLFLNQIPYCILLPRRIWKKLNGYDESFDSGYEDWEFNIRMGINGYFGHVIPLPLFNYRVSATGMLISKSNKLHNQLWKKIQDKHVSTFKIREMFKIWRLWRTRPSTYPLCFYFLWFFLYKVMPDKLFIMIFRLLRRYSHSQRLTRKLIN